MALSEGQNSARTFTFVTVTNPCEMGESPIRHQVRSTAATGAWMKRKSPYRREAIRVKSCEEPRGPSRGRHSRQPSEASSTTSRSSAEDQSPEPNHANWHSLVTSDFQEPVDLMHLPKIPQPVSHNKVLTRDGQQSTQEKPVIESTFSIQRSPYHQGPSRGPLVTSYGLEPLGLSDAILFNVCPGDSELWYMRLLHYFHYVYLPRGWPALHISETEGRAYLEYKQKLMMAEPAMFYMEVLSAVGSFIFDGLAKPETAFWLRDKTIKAIYKALRDPKQPVTTALILTVGRITLFECLYGDVVAAIEAHRPAQGLMIEMKGGLEALDMPTSVQKYTTWSDITVSLLTGTPRMFSGPCFTALECAEALRAYAPGRFEHVTADSYEQLLT